MASAAAPAAVSKPRPDPSALPAAFTHDDALRTGWSTCQLHAAFERGDIQRVARGVYAQTDLKADPELVEIAVRAPGATLCLPSALAYHGLVDQPPSALHFALPSGQRVPRTQARVNWHQVDDGTFEIGRSELTVVDRIAVGVYSATRTIIDAYGLAYFYGTETVRGLLRHWLAMPDSDSDELVAMTHHFGDTGDEVRQALQALRTPEWALRRKEPA